MPPSMMNDKLWDLEHMPPAFQISFIFVLVSLTCLCVIVLKDKMGRIRDKAAGRYKTERDPVTGRALSSAEVSKKLEFEIMQHQMGKRDNSYFANNNINNNILGNGLVPYECQANRPAAAGQPRHDLNQHAEMMKKNPNVHLVFGGIGRNTINHGTTHNHNTNDYYLKDGRHQEAFAGSHSNSSNASSPNGTTNQLTNEQCQGIFLDYNNSSPTSEKNNGDNKVTVVNVSEKTDTKAVTGSTGFFASLRRGSKNNTNSSAETVVGANAAVNQTNPDNSTAANLGRRRGSVMGRESLTEIDVRKLAKLAKPFEEKNENNNNENNINSDKVLKHSKSSTSNNENSISSNSGSDCNTDVDMNSINANHKGRGLSKDSKKKYVLFNSLNSGESFRRSNSSSSDVVVDGAYDPQHANYRKKRSSSIVGNGAAVKKVLHSMSNNAAAPVFAKSNNKSANASKNYTPRDFTNPRKVQKIIDERRNQRDNGLDRRIPLEEIMGGLKSSR